MRFWFWRQRIMIECERTDLSDFIFNVCNVRTCVAEEPSAAVNTTLPETVREVGRTRSVSVRSRAWQ